MKKNALVAGLVIGAAVVPGVSLADVTGNVGYNSDYIYRGVFQADSSAFAGADYAGDNGLYIGTWWADVTQGTETDIYFGWQGGGDTVQFKIGYTGYFYFDDFDGDYQEVNLGLYAGIFSFDVAVGTYDAETIWGLDDQDYIFTSVTLAPEVGPYYKIGLWSGDITDNVFPLFNKDGDTAGEYAEIGYTYSMEDAGVDFSAALIYSDNLPLAANGFGNPDAGEFTLTFSIKKTFSEKE
jgi:uncharacterized protein (TIGR02001 family)